MQDEAIPYTDKAMANVCLVEMEKARDLFKLNCPIQTFSYLISASSIN
jgi:hypothetical protein